jgi:hypothetical protein
MVIVSLIGGTILLLVLTLLWDKLVFARLKGDPVVRKLAAVAAAWLSCSLLLAWAAHAGGEPLASSAFVGVVFFLLPALVVGVLGYRQGKALRARPGPGAEVASVFE